MVSWEGLLKGKYCINASTTEVYSCYSVCPGMEGCLNLNGNTCVDSTTYIVQVYMYRCRYNNLTKMEPNSIPMYTGVFCPPT